LSGQSVEITFISCLSLLSCFQVSSATAGFITKLKENIGDSTFHRQIVQIGILMEFESLISCYGDEMGMLEDMDVAIKDLANVSYRIEKRNSLEDDVVTISGTRLVLIY